MPSNKPTSIAFVALVLLSLNIDKFIACGNKTENVWRMAGKLTGLLLNSCMQLRTDGPQERFLLILQQCLKRGSLLILRKSLEGDVIKLATGIELVRYRSDNDTNDSRYSSTSNQSKNDWKNQIIGRISHVLDTHVLRIRLDGHEKFNNLIGEARGRRRKNNMVLSLLMFGVVAVGLIMVPMGFQFLAVLGGKALLLAKMALILTAIQGLKKIATSNVNYGLYATSPERNGHCKDELCYLDYKYSEIDDSIFIGIDVDDFPQTDVANFNLNAWHYDRQWPYDVESHNVGIRQTYYDVPEQQSDLLHPLHPRVDYHKI